MGKKLTLTQIKKELNKKTAAELVGIICELCKTSKEAADMVNLTLGNDSFVDDALADAKAKVRNQFFPKRGFGQLDLRAAKSAITAFKKVCNVSEKLIDLQMYYVECGIEFTNTYGDINASFYNSVGGMYAVVVESLIKLDDSELTKKFMPRLEKAVSDAEGIGWGFPDDLYNSFLQIVDCEE